MSILKLLINLLSRSPDVNADTAVMRWR